ncbi:MAG: hypothetical protein HOM68_29325 [Gemmatimonadetes bacterium]|jgi:hypothetical protein|nr:hypothetical protein [Gemmatimonadota bacterium]MBT4610919.1 hypothetical protein [Gemmatimonadota bacterium]MBT5060682.1 hypothetical protein [Gemmatimonadota bacterium]MBT5145408.1 hypothetical protein [Gemmatimonadota bacterium]MBT5591596.1 hypothetical protein [Gemmatimonadota bacterium]
MSQRDKLLCDTCGKQVDQLRRDVVDEDYNALTKPPLWNCDDCYEQKRAQRQQSQAESA